MPSFIAYLLQACAYGIVAALLILPLIAVNIKFAARLGLVDWPKTRGINERHVPIIGYSLVLFALLAMSWGVWCGELSINLLCGGLMIALMGYLDDRHAFAARPKLLWQIISSTFVVLMVPDIQNALSSFGPWSPAIAVVFLVGMKNAVNFIDGIDGLAGVVLIAGSVGYLFLAQPFEEVSGSVWLISLHLGTLVPFLYLNVFRRAGFLGNVGSYFFSFLLGVVHLGLPLQSRFLIPKLSISVLCFLIPVADSLTVITLRLLTHRSPFQPDKGHLHHRLVRTGLNLRHILLIFASLEVSGLALAWIMGKEPSIRGTWLPFLVGGSEVVTTALLILLVEKASRRRVQDYLKALGLGQKVRFASYKLTGAHGNHFTWRELKRVEAMINTEIRISDLCYVDAPNTVFLVTRGNLDSFQRVQKRVDNILEREKIGLQEPVQTGEYRAHLEETSSPLRKAV